ncbi:MAG: sugar ABC transporter permease [Spirochaetes bacterium]|nr:sugar ABC transporter permease [Spirochaetota bacterium]
MNIVSSPGRNPGSLFPTRSGLLRRKGKAVDRAALLFVGPYLLLFVSMKLAPIIFGVYVSFTDWSIVRAPKWVGLKNYLRVLDDPWVAQVWINTLKMALLVVPGTVIISMLFALYVNRKWRFSNMVRTFVFAPKAVAITVTSMIWVWILEKEKGILNILLSGLGLPKVGWLTSIDWVIPSIAVVTIWWGVGYYMVILLAGLQDIPRELIDSARLDGASDTQVFWNITLPMLRPALVLIITLEIIASLRIFGQVQLMTAGGPGGRSATIVSYIYSTGFQRFDLGYAAALSFLLFLTTIVFSWIRFKVYGDADY